MPDTLVGRLDTVTDTRGRPFVPPVGPTGEVVVEVQGAPAARLDLAQPNGGMFAEMLLQLVRYNLPVLLEVEPRSDQQPAIVNVEVPHAVRAASIAALPSGDLVVSVPPLPSPRVLRRAAEGFDESYAVLMKALRDQTPVFITGSSGDRSIGHVVDAPSRDDFFGNTGGQPSCLLSEPDVLKLVTVIGPSEAQQVFLRMCTLACDPVAVNDVCTPFAYVIDGCDARAHEMCQEMVKRGMVPAKVWLVSDSILTPETPNVPGDCFATWTFHVAPVVRVTTTRGEEWRVIDPSLYAGSSVPPTIEEWKARQRDPYATFTISEAGLLYNASASGEGKNVCDRDFLLAQRELAKYRCDLISQVRRYGPPPYCR